MARQFAPLESIAGAIRPLKPVQEEAPAPKPEPVVAAPKKPKSEPKSRPHTSLYVSKAVQKMIRRIAWDTEKRPHDVLLEAVDDVLRKYGKPGIKELDKTS